MFWSVVCLVCVSALGRTQVIPGKSRTADGDYNTVNTDGSFDFGYANKDRGASYHLAHGNANKVVGGRFGAVDPATNSIKETVYTAGPRGFRAKGPNVHRKMDLDQRPRGPIGNKDDPYFDPNEDPSYSFKFDTRTYSKNENADARGDVKGHYSYVDDVGERHDVNYIAGRDTGFHVSSAHPDSPNVIGSPFHRAPLVRGETRPRGRTAIQRGLDGSYRFISAGPDQRRTESSDSHGNVRGSYTFLDDKGVQRTVHYIAGPGIGYRIVKNGKDPYISSAFPTIPSAYDPDFVNAGSTSFSPDDTGADDVFKRPDGTAASGHVKPPPFADKERPGKKPTSAPTSPSAPDDNSIEDGFNAIFSPGPSGGSDFNQGSGETSFEGPSSSGGDSGYGQGSSKPSFGQGSSSPSFGQGSSSPGFGQGSSGPSLTQGSQGSGGSAFGQRPTSGSPNRPPYGQGSGGSSGSNYGQGTSGGGTRPSFGPGSTSRPSYGQGSTSRPSYGQGSSGSGGSSFGQGSSGSGGPSFGQGSSGPGFGQGGDGEGTGFGASGGDETAYVDEDGGFGQKPTKGPGKPSRPRPPSAPYRPTKKPYVPLKPFQPTNSKDDDVTDFHSDVDDSSAPQVAIGFGNHQKPGVTTIYRPGTTIIRNIGQDYFGVPPGVSVRAHVQSIDLYPYDSKPLSPSEAIEKDKT